MYFDIRLSALTEVLHNSCNTGAHDLPDMYAHSPQALSIHIRQITHAHVLTIDCSWQVTDEANKITKDPVHYFVVLKSVLHLAHRMIDILN